MFTLRLFDPRFAELRKTIEDKSPNWDLVIFKNKEVKDLVADLSSGEVMYQFL